MKRTITLYLALLFFPILLQAQSINEGTASERLINQIQDAPEGNHLVYVLLSDYVDATELGRQFEQSKLPIAQRVETLIATLKQKADETQPELINYLKNLDGVETSTIKPFWVTNTIFVEANAEAIASLSNHPKIYWMDANAENALSEHVEVDCAMPPVPDGIEAGLQVINAPALWAMGYTGYGQIAFTADTGIDPWHPSISLKFQGLYSNADEAWVSFNNNGTPNNNTTPTNCGDHGNHTAGTILGLDRMTNDTIGVAYGASRERAYVVIPDTELENGSYVIEVELLNPNEVVDQKPLNNRGIKRFDYYGTDDYDLYVGGMDNVSPCAGASALLYSDYEGDGIIHWYTSLISNNPVATGNSYVTSVLNTDRTYYTELVNLAYEGEVDLDPQTKESDIIDGGIIIDAEFAFTLKSIKIYPESTGTRYLELYDSSGELIETKPLYAFTAGEQRMEIDLEIPVGQNMVIRLGEDGFALPYSGGANYPYDIGEDLGTIKRSTHPSTPLDTWFYFYDWEVESPNYCERKTIEVDIVADTDVPTAQFSSSADFVDFGNNEEVVFTNESENATQWLWSFGDGNTSTDENPNHLYTEEGIYTISLTVQGAGVCSDSYSKIIDIQTLVNDDEPEGLAGKVTVFPNPVTDLIHVQYEFEETQQLELKVMDALGRPIHELSERTYAKGEQLIDSSDWPNGMYYMVFTNGRSSLVRKLVRMEVE